MNTTASRDTDIILVESNDQDSELITRTLAKNSILNKTIRLKNGGELLDYLF